MIERRALLRGLFALPAIVAVGSLMPIRGIVMPVNYKGNVDLLIRGLVDDGIWKKMDWIVDCRHNRMIVNTGETQSITCSYRVVENLI
jgi:hypothetical protein